LTHPDLVELFRQEGGKRLSTFAQAFA